jgi:hypothetical protein
MQNTTKEDCFPGPPGARKADPCATESVSASAVQSWCETSYHWGRRRARSALEAVPGSRTCWARIF